MSDKQELAIDLINSGENIFLTGKAGTGKSYTSEKVTNENTLITSSTGISALNVGGETTHSSFGLPLGVVTEDDKKKETQKFRELFNNSTITRIICDEISMTRADYFDLIDYRLKNIKNNNLPFGGIQMVIVGDCYQLPPVVSFNEKRIFHKNYISPWFFTTKSFKDANFKTIELDKIYRQDNAEQVDALNKIRSKEDGWEEAVDKMNKWGKEQKHDVEMRLCSYNNDADKINQEQYDALKTEERTYTGVITGNFKAADCIVPMSLKLKIGCRVMIAANSTVECADEYKNGLVGTVIEFGSDHVYVDTDKFGEVRVDVAKFEKFSYNTLGGKIKKSVSGSFVQIPLRLGYAVSVHKSQGLTLDSVAIDFGEKGAFAPALVYVALSRVRDLNDMHLVRKLRYEDVMVDSKVKRFMEKHKL